MSKSKKATASASPSANSTASTRSAVSPVHTSSDSGRPTEEDDAQFDASHFISTLLGSASLIDRLVGIEKHRPILFVLPGRGGERWMSNASTLGQHLEDICFATEVNGHRAISLAGIPAIIADDAIQMAGEPDDAFSMEGGISGYDFDVAASKWTGLAFHDVPIRSRFSIDSDGVIAKVYVIDAGEEYFCRREEVKPGSLQALTSPAASTTTARNSSHSVDSLSRAVMAASKGQSNLLPWRETLLRKLRDPEAAPIVKEIKRLIKYLAQEEVPTSGKAEITQHFYGDLGRLLQSNAAWREASKEELEGSLDAIEKYIFGKVNIFVYQPVDVDDQLQDKLFYDKTGSLSRLSPSDLAAYLGRPDGKDANDENDANDANDEKAQSTPLVPLRDTKLALSACSELQSPIEKLDALVGLIKNCALEIDGGVGSADLLLPTLVQLVLTESPRTLISDVRYIQRFRNHSRLVGEASYCLTNVVAVITMIEKIYAERVAKSDPIYSMLASQDNLLLGGAPMPAPSMGKAQTGARTMLAHSPSSDINSMASSFINTIGFVPRAIGSAVADTFRSRSSAVQAGSKEKTSPSADARRHSSLLSIGGDASLAVPVEIRELRKKMAALPPKQTGSITLHEMELIIEDYRRLLDYLV